MALGNLVRFADRTGEIRYKTNPRRRLGSLLLSGGFITETQLEQALADQVQTGERLGRILLERGYVSKQTLGQVLEAQSGVPYVNLSAYPIDEQLVRKLPEWLVMQHKVVAIAQIGQEIHLAMLDPTDVMAIDSARRLLGARIRPLLITEHDFDWAVSRYFDIRRRVGESLRRVAQEDSAPGDSAPVTLLESADDVPVVRVVNSILGDAVRVNATDIHIEMGADEANVRFRVDGLLHDKATLPRSVAVGVISRVKVLAGLDIAEHWRPQDGRILLDVEGRQYDLRIATVGSAYGERVALRLLNTRQVELGLERLGLLSPQQEVMRHLLARPYGMILVTGPTGSGKTTTLYAALSSINERLRNIMTVEDPVEYRLAGLTQIPVREKAGVTFDVGLRAILRQDPDVIMVGEIRDAETASIAVHAALTGHLVLSTLHTNNAAGAMVRLLDMSIEPFLLTSSVFAVVGQRLVRTLCSNCKRHYRPPPSELAMLDLSPADEVLLFRPGGCEECGSVGYRGRTGVFEIVVMSDAIRDLVLLRRPEAAIMETARETGMMTLREAAIRAVLEGVTGLDELRRLVQAEAA